jgi:hypothetical protein
MLRLSGSQLQFLLWWLGPPLVVALVVLLLWETLIELIP